jgi:hypothetical protein
MGNRRFCGYTALEAHGVVCNSSKRPDRKIMAGAKPNILELELQPRRGTSQSICQGLLELLDRRRWFIFAGLAAAYLLAFNGQWLVEPDGGLYLNLARNLALGRGYTYGGIRHDTVYPGFPLALAGLYRVFPTHIIFAADIFILLCSIASLALVYRLILLAYDRPTAVLVTLGLGLSHEFFQYSFEILTEMPFLMGVMAVLVGHEAVFGPRAPSRAHWWDWALLAAGVVIATSTRPTMIGLLFAWVVTLLYTAVVRRNWKAGAALVICALVVCTFILFDPRRSAGHGLAGGYEQYAINQLSQTHVLWLTATANIRALLDPILAKAAFGMRLLPGMNAPFGIIVAAAATAVITKRLLWGLWVILTLVPLVLFVSNDRYLLPILPFMVLGWWNLVRAVDARIPGRLGNALVLFLLTLGMAPNIIQVVGTIYHQRMHPFLAEYKDGKYEVFAHIAPDVARETGPADLVLCPPKSARMIAFLADRICFEENEAYPAAGHVFVIVDPADADYVHWLRAENIRPVGETLATAARRGGQPAIYLVRARIGPEK